MDEWDLFNAECSCTEAELLSAMTSSQGLSWHASPHLSIHPRSSVESLVHDQMALSRGRWALPTMTRKLERPPTCSLKSIPLRAFSSDLRSPRAIKRRLSLTITLAQGSSTRLSSHDGKTHWTRHLRKVYHVIAITSADTLPTGAPHRLSPQLRFAHRNTVKYNVA